MDIGNFVTARGCLETSSGVHSLGG